MINKHPELIERLDWKTLAGERAREELDAIAGHREGVLAWGQFFPDRTYPEQIEPGLVIAYRDWTKQRAAQMPNRITMFVQPRRVTDAEGEKITLFEGRQYKDSLMQVASVGVPGENMLNGTVNTQQIAITGSDPLRLYHFAMLLPNAARSYLWKLSDEQEEEVKKRWSSTPWWTPGGDVDLEVTGVRLEPKESMLIVEVKPVEFRMIEDNKVVFTMHAPAL